MRGVIGALCVFLALSMLVTPACSTFFISKKIEIEIGKGVAEQIRQGNAIVTDPEKLARVQRIGQQLVAESVRKDDIPYAFTIIKKNEINAFALLGGPIFIYEPLLDMMETDDELAFVLSHEMSHIDRQHGRKNLDKAIWEKALMGAAFGKSSEIVQSAVGLGYEALVCGHSRHQENEADEFGIHYMEEAGFNPKGAMLALAKLGGERYRGSLGRLYKTHPPTPERIERARTQIAEEWPDHPEYLPAESEEAGAGVVGTTEHATPFEGTSREVGVIAHGELIGELNLDWHKGLPRVALVGYPRGDTNQVFTEICSVLVSGTEYELPLPGQVAESWFQAGYNGVFQLFAYYDENQDACFRPGDDAPFGLADIKLIYNRRERQINELVLGWNTIEVKNLSAGEVRVTHDFGNTSIDIAKIKDR